MIQQLQVAELNFNSEFGDFVLESDDIPLVNNRKKFILNYINEKLKTNIGEIFQLPSYGTRLDTFVGIGLTASVIEAVKQNIKESLSSDNILADNDFEVYHIVRNNTLELRIIVELETTTISTDIIINNEGVTIDY
jgi:hypothetical protein